MNSFGGDWTVQKLDILEKYLKAYTSVFKNQLCFELLYIDAFAGSGGIELDQKDAEDIKRFIAGSAVRALEVDNRPFDRFIFVERSPSLSKKLETLRDKNPDRTIEILEEDANAFLQRYLRKIDPRKKRGVLFLDPFATQVEWKTIKQVASVEIFDTWILFPTNAIARMLPVNKKPDEISKRWADRLDIVYGGNDWIKVYSEVLQQDLFGDPHRDSGTEKLIEIYKKKLKKLVGNRFLKLSLTLCGLKNVPLFELMFFTGSSSKKAIETSHRIAKDIMGKYKRK